MARDHRSSSSDETASREHTATFRWQVLRRHVEDGTPLTQLAGLEGIGVRTLLRWLAAYRRDGVAGLLPVVPKRARRTHPALQTLIEGDRKSTRLNSSHVSISYAVFCLKKKNSTHSVRTP